ncbi:MAG: haloacid dehalogenase-like hydrolase, partial [Thermomicrobiales bacterium]|nr:haloacid dehalogenase-like hydrolase [Thermomicrobiales bacterium]
MNGATGSPGRSGVSRRAMLRGIGAGLAGLALGMGPGGTLWQEVQVSTSALALQMADPLPSWHEGPRKQAIMTFVAAATDEATTAFVPPPDRIATFDMDGTLWVEMPLYTESTFTVERIEALAPAHPEWVTTEPFATLTQGDFAAMGKLTEAQWVEVMDASVSGVTVRDYELAAATWLASAKHPRFERLYTSLVYQPMLEVMAYLRANEFRTYIVSGSGQMFMRSFAEHTFGVPPEQVIGTAYDTTYEMGNNGAPVIMVDQVMLVNDNFGGKPEDIDLFIGRRPAAAFGNSTGDQQMLEWTGAGERATLMMLV